MNQRLGTDSLGRAIYECVDCKTREGAPYTHCTDDKHRCRQCVHTYDREQAFFGGIGQEALTALRRLESAASTWTGNPGENEAIIEARRIIDKADDALIKIRAQRRRP